MIRIYGGTVTEGAQDGIEVGTEENPILFDGLYPAPNGEAIKELTFAIRSDNENDKLEDVCLVIAMLDENGRDIDPNGEVYIFPYTDANYNPTWVTRGQSITLNKQTLLFKEINLQNQTFKIRVKAKGNEDVSIVPDVRCKLYIIPAAMTLTKIS